VQAGGLHYAETRAYLLRYYGSNDAARVDDPVQTVTSLDRFGLVTVHGAQYVVADIGMRMLAARELYRAQGFPDDYLIDVEARRQAPDEQGAGAHGRQQRLPAGRRGAGARAVRGPGDRGGGLRQDIIWSKPNPMPESVRDRFTKAHEYIFLLSKNDRYYFDQEAILEPVSLNTHARVSQDVAAQIGSARAHAGGKTNGAMKAVVRSPKIQADRSDGIKNNASFINSVALMVNKRNKRSVWTVGTSGFKEAHFATFPPALIEPCILAGAPRGGVVLDPFGGAGTTGLVADRNGRDAVLIELNPAYADMAERRITGDAPLFTEVAA
jgi:hypothetical protein